MRAPRERGTLPALSLRLLLRARFPVNISQKESYITMVELGLLAGLVIVGAVFGVLRSRRGDTRDMPSPFQRSSRN